MDFGNIVKDLAPNSDIVLMNTIYNKGKYGDKDALILVFKDIKTNQKHVRVVEEPPIEYYKLKQGVTPPVNVELTIDKAMVEIKDAIYKNKIKDIATDLGPDVADKFWRAVKSRNMNEFKLSLAQDKRIYSIDRDIEDHYMYKSVEYFGAKDEISFSKGFGDIEVDLELGSVDLKTSKGDAPINAVTLIDDKTMTVYTLLLRNHRNPLIEEFEKDLHGFIDELHTDFDDKYGKFNYKIKMFDEDDEISLIRMFFDLVNSHKFDFVLFWNMSFDIRYFINRIEGLGYNPEDIICDPSMPYKVCKYYKDDRNQKIKLKTDHFQCSCIPVYIDQMILYGAVRKSSSELDSYSLDFIGDLEVGVHKIDYSDFATIRTLPYKNYKLFVKYNIMDVIVQYCIEKKVQDIQTLFQRAYESNTRYNKVFKETIFLGNVFFKSFLEQGLVLGNNVNGIMYNMTHNSDDDDDDEKFDGAVVGDPLLNRAKGICVFSNIKSSSVFEDVVDYDYSSLYPSIIRLFNIFASTQYGRVIMDNKNRNYEKEPEIVVLKKGKMEVEDYDRGGKLCDDLELREPLQFGYRWLNLPSIFQLIKRFKAYLKDRQYVNVDFRRITEDEDKGFKKFSAKRIKEKMKTFSAKFIKGDK